MLFVFCCIMGEVSLVTPLHKCNTTQIYIFKQFIALNVQIEYEENP